MSGAPSSGRDRHGFNANIPSRWFTDPVMRSLSCGAWGLHVWALVWCTAQENDGQIPESFLGFVAGPMLTAEQAEDAAAELVEARVWKFSESGGLQIVDWSASQTPAAEIDAMRAGWRAKKRRSRHPGVSPGDANAEARGDAAKVSPLSQGDTPGQSQGVSGKQRDVRPGMEGADAHQVDPWLPKSLTGEAIQQATSVAEVETLLRIARDDHALGLVTATGQTVGDALSDRLVALSA